MAKARSASSPDQDTRKRIMRREPPAPLAYRIDDAAHAIGVGRTKLYSLIAEQKIIARKRDGVTFILADDLRAYLAGAEATKADQ